MKDMKQFSVMVILIACLGTAGALQTTRRGPLKGAGEWTHQYLMKVSVGLQPM